MTNLRQQPDPPPALEARVLAHLRSEGLIDNRTSGETDMRKVHLAWAAAAAGLMIVGVLIGRMPAASQPEDEAATGAPAPGAASSPASAASSPASAASSASSVASTQDARAEYALLLYEDATYQTSAQPDSSDRVAEYGAWARQLAADGSVVGGEKLADTGVLLASSESSARIPQSDVGALTGYFVIRASDDADAARIAATCPHVKYGGRISIRRIET